MACKNDSLGDRMKEYEHVPRISLTRRIPAIIRIDGKAFHSFTKGFERPFDPVLHEAMNNTTKALCEGIQGCVLGYTQSDEITLVLIDYQSIKTDAWFGYGVQKMTSIAASMATMIFNREFTAAVERWKASLSEDVDTVTGKLIDIRNKKCGTAIFDARVFSVPKDEVCNCLIWRQQDATRNSIEMVGQANFSHKQLHGKSCNVIQEMLWGEKNINWNDFPTQYKRGVCCYKVEQFIPCENGTQLRYPDGCADPMNDQEVEHGVYRKKWIIDTEIPIFTKDRDFIDKHLKVEE